MFAPVEEVIAALKLVPLAGEGGFVRQAWRSETGSAAYYLMTATDFSALHRLRAHEVWHFYVGDAIEHVTLDPRTGEAVVIRLGPRVAAGEQPQLAVPPGVWQGARLAPPDGTERAAVPRAGPSVEPRAGWALVGCALTPAWNERDFEAGTREALLREFPAAAEWICTLTRA